MEEQIAAVRCRISPPWTFPTLASTYRSTILKLPKQLIYPEHPIVGLDRERLHCESRSDAKVTRTLGIGSANKFGEARPLLLVHLRVQQNQEREIRKRAVCAKGDSVHAYQHDDGDPECANNPSFHFSSPRQIAKEPDRCRRAYLRQIRHPQSNGKNPAVRPLSFTICNGSASETFWVKLFPGPTPRKPNNRYGSYYAVERRRS